MLMNLLETFFNQNYSQRNKGKKKKNEHIYDSFKNISSGHVLSRISGNCASSLF